MDNFLLYNFKFVDIKINSVRSLSEYLMLIQRWNESDFRAIIMYSYDKVNFIPGSIYIHVVFIFDSRVFTWIIDN